MKVISTNPRTNDLLDAIIELASRRYGFTLEHLVDTTHGGFSRRAPKKTRKFGRVATAFEYIVHEISHVIVHQRSTRRRTKRSDDVDFRSQVDEMLTAALTGSIVSGLKVPKWTWRARSGACLGFLKIGGRKTCVQQSSEQCIATLVTLSQTRDVYDWCQDVVAATRHIAGDMPGYTPSLNSFNDELDRL